MTRKIFALVVGLFILSLLFSATAVSANATMSPGVKPDKTHTPGKPNSLPNGKEKNKAGKPTNGMVTAYAMDSSITVQDRNGVSMTYALSTTTRYLPTARLSALQIGVQVSVKGYTTKDGVLTASQVVIQANGGTPWPTQMAKPTKTPKPEKTPGSDDNGNGNPGKGNNGNDDNDDNEATPTPQP